MLEIKPLLGKFGPGASLFRHVLHDAALEARSRLFRECLREQVSLSHDRNSDLPRFVRLALALRVDVEKLR